MIQPPDEVFEKCGPCVAVGTRSAVIPVIQRIESHKSGVLPLARATKCVSAISLSIVAKGCYW
jgi:hypothetical protein